MSAFNMFQKANKNEYMHLEFGDRSRELGKRWGKMSASQKRPFEQQAKAINEGKAQAGGAAKKQRVKEPPAAGQEVITLD